MVASIYNLVLKLPPLWRFGGPIFEKELRVSSRRKRNYALRFVYVILLTAFVAGAWAIMIDEGSSSSVAFRASRMPELGKYIVSVITWFQFLAIQLVCIVMLSTSISDEIYNRTLAVLMSTPISSFQIVAGKLVGKLLQLILLLAVSLPLLAIVRVFGGVPWGYIVSSLCITLSAAAFVGSISLLLSAYNRHAHLVISQTLSICFLLFAAIPALLAMLQQVYQLRIIPQIVFMYASPFAVMMINTRRMLNPAFGLGPVSWPVHCIIMTAGSLLVLALATVCVRRVGLRQATGQAGIFGSRKERRLAERGSRPAVDAACPSAPIRCRKERRLAERGSRPAVDHACPSALICPVKGPPIVWKEMRIPMAKSRRPLAVIASAVTCLLLVGIYVYCGSLNAFGGETVQTAFVWAYLFLGLLRTAVVAATTVTSEREARTWPILLATPLDDRQIILGKVIASCLRAWPFWLLLAAHLVVFGIAGCLNIIGVLPALLVIAASAIAVSAMGVFFSSSFKRSSVASTVNLFVFFGVMTPTCSPLSLFWINPFHVVAILLRPSSSHGVTLFSAADSIWTYASDILRAALVAPVIALIYLLLSGVAIAWAGIGLRRKVFR